MTDAPPSSPPSVTATSTALPSSEDWLSPLVSPQSSPAVERLFRRRTGVVPAVVPYICPHPWAHRVFLYLMAPSLRRIDADLCSKISFVVARDNACRFCYGSFRTFLRIAGYTPAELDRLENKLHLNGEASGKDEALSFSVLVSQGRFEAASVASLRAAGYDDVAIREIVGVAVLTALANRMGTMLAVPIDEAAEHRTGQWYFDWLQPVLYSLLSGWQQLGRPQPPLAAETVEGPFAPWIRRLRDTHVGRLVDDAVTTWLEGDGALPLRTKLLVLAIVARGLDCRALEAQTREVVVHQCGVAADDYDAAVNHLRGDALDEREAGLLPLARASIRYEAGRLQQTVRPHTQSLSRTETIEAVATLGLTNALARLCVLAALEE